MCTHKLCNVSLRTFLRCCVIGFSGATTYKNLEGLQQESASSPRFAGWNCPLEPGLTKNSKKKNRSASEKGSVLLVTVTRKDYNGREGGRWMERRCEKWCCGVRRGLVD